MSNKISTLKIIKELADKSRSYADKIPPELREGILENPMAQAEQQIIEQLCLLAFGGDMGQIIHEVIFCEQLSTTTSIKFHNEDVRVSSFDEFCAYLQNHKGWIL